MNKKKKESTRKAKNQNPLFIPDLFPHNEHQRFIFYFYLLLEKQPICVIYFHIHLLKSINNLKKLLRYLCLFFSRHKKDFTEKFIKVIIYIIVFDLKMNNQNSLFFSFKLLRPKRKSEHFFFQILLGLWRKKKKNIMISNFLTSQLNSKKKLKKIKNLYVIYLGDICLFGFFKKK